jgi:hypothetical protein
MRFSRIGVAMMFVPTSVLAQERPDGPTDEKAQKAYKGALQLLHDRQPEWALRSFKKADKEDGGHCRGCQQMIKYGVEFGDWKAAEQGAEEMIAEAQGEKAVALAHYEFAVVLMDEALQRHKEEYFTRAHEEAARAVAPVHVNFPDAVYLDGEALARLQQDDAAKARFEEFVKMKPEGDPARRRAQRYIGRRSPLSSWMDRKSPWTICKARSCCWISGPRGASLAARHCHTFERWQKNFKGSRW